MPVDKILCSNKYTGYFYPTFLSSQWPVKSTISKNPNKTYNLKSLNKMAIIDPTHITDIKLNLKTGLKPQISLNMVPLYGEDVIFK